MIGERRVKSILFAVVVAVLPTSLQAGALHTIWRLEPVSSPPSVATWNKMFLTERLLPFRAVRLMEEATPFGMAPIPAGTILFEAFDERGISVFCTIKDRSMKHAAKSFFYTCS